MDQARRLGVAVGVLLLTSGPATADDYEIRWSASLEAALHSIASQEADDDVTGFFDQYEFVPNKDDDVPAEIGLTEASFDLLGAGETPLLRFRLDSPTSNLGITDPAHPFLNQRALLSGGHNGLFLDLRYRRLRTEDLRRFPDPTGSGGDITDLTSPDDRFYQERTGFDGVLRFRPHDALDGLPELFSTLGPELEVRGGYDTRDGERQRRFHFDPTGDWISLDQDVDQEVGTVGGGLLAAPWGLFTLALDVDHQRFRENDPTFTDDDLGAPLPSGDQPIGFVPDTDRTTGTLRLQSRIGDRAAIRGAVQMALLEQVDSETPEQRTEGLDDNFLVFTSANFVADVRILDNLSANAFFKYDERNNRIDRDTDLFNGGGGSQVDAFLDHWRRIAAGGEIVHSFRGRNRAALGVRAEWVDRDLDFVDRFTPERHLLAENASIADDTQMVTVYGRTRLRPLRGLALGAELGYRDAPETGYVVDLDEYVYGEADVSYVVPLERPVVLSGFARGSSGENQDFSFVGGMGPDPAGPTLDRDFERTQIFWGLTATSSPWKRLTLFASYFQSHDAQDYDLILSNQPRYFQQTLDVTFTRDGPVDYRSDDLGIMSGFDVRVDERTDAGFSYSWNRIKTRYRTGGSTSGGIEDIEDLARIDADIHRFGLRLGHRLSDGLRLTAGYRFDYFDDRSPEHGSGVVDPFDLRTHQHTVTFGVTLTDELLD